MKRSNVVIAMPYKESKFNGMKHFARLSISALKGRQLQQFCHTQIRSKGEPAIKCGMYCLRVIKEAIPCCNRKDFQSAIQTLKENCLSLPEQPSDLRPLGRSNLGEGSIMDEIYVNVAIHEGTAHHNFAEDLDRWERLKEYLPDAKDSGRFAKPEDIIDKEHTNILVVGRPGIGKTLLSIKMLRLWASGEAFNGDHHEKSAHFDVVFLVKFRCFNDNVELSLRELLARAETVKSLDDSVWDFINKETTKVLLIFDGLDEYSRKEDINTQDDPTYNENDVEERIPVSVLYNKLAKGKLLGGASILTTTRPTAVKYVDHASFRRTVEIRGFTSKDVEEYVEKFARGVHGAKEKILEHVESNINLFSLCYSPVNCFLICHFLLQIIVSESSQALPTKITHIYKLIVKMLFLNHNREGLSQEELERLKSTHINRPIESFPEELQNILQRLGEIAFKGIEEERLLFESSEVQGLEDCGLLHKLPNPEAEEFGDPPKSKFCFIHLTVQEFFAAKHLVDTKTKRKIERVVRKHINDGRWQVVLQFIAGLLRRSSSDIFINLFLKKTKKRPKRIFWSKEDKNAAVKLCNCLCEVNDEDQQKLQNKIGKINVKTVNLSGCSIAPIDLAAVLHFLENAKKVLQINLSFNELGDLGAKDVIKFINRTSKLKRLTLSDNKFTDKAAGDLAAALMRTNCQLEVLDLSRNYLTDKAAEDLAASLKNRNCKLKLLYLSGNYFTDNAAEDLAAALKHSNCRLKSLDLSCNRFTGKAAKDLDAALRHNSCKLESLDLSYNKFTKEGHRTLTKAGKHSNCKVSFSFMD